MTNTRSEQIGAKDQIDSLRGVACVLLVFFHAFESFYNAGHLGRSEFLRSLTDSMAFLRMPLFTFLSGYVYSIHPVVIERLNKFIYGKARRLLFPLIFVGVPVGVLQATFGTGTEITLSDAFLSPVIPTVTVYWYLNALFIIFVIFSLVEISGLTRNRFGLSALVLISLVIYASPLREIKYLGFAQAAYLFPFFLAGVVVQRINLNLISRAFGWAFFSTTACVAVIVTFKYQLNGVDIRGANPLFAILSIWLCFSLYLTRFRNSLLMKVGIYSYSIFLFHSLVVPGVRIVVVKYLGYEFIGNSHYIILMFFSFIMGIIVPVVIHKILISSSITSQVFLGIRLKKNISRSNVSSKPASESA